MIGEDGRPLHSILSARWACQPFVGHEPPAGGAHGDCLTTATGGGRSWGQAVGILFAILVKSCVVRARLAHVTGEGGSVAASESQLRL